MSLVILSMAACGGSDGTSNPNPSPSPSPSTTGFYIGISGMAFSPLELRVPPGGTVTVLNFDGIAHSVTSEATTGTYTPGAVAGISFDTGLFTAGQRTFTIPASAANGTVIPYYCMDHKSTMVTPNGTIRVDSTATPSAPPSAPSPPMGGY
jgi:plastocyanin